MSGKPILVLCATVPWRLEACTKMLRSLERQTRRPTEVILHLDGFPRGSPRPSLPDGILVSQTRHRHARGVGNWWRSLDERHLGMLVACVGDDFVYPPDYLERLAQMRAEYGGAVAWHGWSVEGRNCTFRIDVEAPTTLVCSGTAFFIADAEHLLGVTEHELADLFFHPAGDDEALISCWLWTRGVRMTRPPGRVNVEHLPEGCDPRSTSIRDPERRKALRQLLKARYGWPDRARNADPRQVRCVAQEADALLMRSSRRVTGRSPSRRNAGSVSQIEPAG